MHKCILIDAQNLSMKKIILNCILQLINVTFGFRDPHYTKTKLVPAQPFYRASNGIRIAYSLQKTLKFLLFCYNNCEDGLLDISFLHFFISKSEVYFCSLFCSQLLDIISGKQCSIAVWDCGRLYLIWPMNDTNHSYWSYLIIYFLIYIIKSNYFTL